MEPDRARDLADCVRSSVAEAELLIAEARRDMAAAERLSTVLDSITREDDIAIRAALERAKVAAARAGFAAGAYLPVAQEVRGWSARRWGLRFLASGLRLIVFGWPR